MKAAVGRLVGEHGRLDYLFANAGINGVWAPIDGIEPDEWDRTVATNLRGAFLTLRPGVPHLKRMGVAELVAFLLSDRARHVTGTPVWIDGAESLLMG